MKELQIKIRPKEEDVCYFPDEFQKIRFCGLEIPQGGGRYFRINWASSEDNFKFWYPFVGGYDAGAYTVIRSGDDIIRLYDEGCRFYSFESITELYDWMCAGNR